MGTNSDNGSSANWSYIGSTINLIYVSIVVCLIIYV